MVLPDILKNAPFFKKIETKQQKQAQAKSGKARAAAQQRVTGAEQENYQPRCCPAPPPAAHTPNRATALFSGRRDVGLPEKQKMRDARKNPNFS